MADLTGQRFGRLTVLGRADYSNKKRGFILCRCDCGEEFVARAYNVVHGRTKSCGCLRSQSASERLKAAWRAKKGEPDGKL